MAKDFAELNRLDHEAGIQAPEAGRKQDLVNKFVKAWENETARRAVKGGTGLSMALTLAACGGSSGGGFAFAPSTQGDAGGAPAAPTTPIQNLIALVDGGITAISGADPIVEVASPTAGADALSTTIGAGGTGTLTLRFDDAEDVVTLDAASDLSGYDTLAIAAGTVDVTAVDLTGITSITVSSGVTLTAAQFLGLSGGVTTGSADSVVTILVNSLAEANDVVAAAAQFALTSGTTINFENAEGGTLTAAQKVAAEAALDQAIATATTTSALPTAIDNLLTAEAAEATFVETAKATLIAEELAPAEALEEITYDQMTQSVTASVQQLDGFIDDIMVQFTNYAQGAFVNASDAVQLEIIADVDAAIASEVSDAATAVADARALIVDENGALDNGLVALADSAFTATENLQDSLEADAAALAALNGSKAAMENANPDLFALDAATDVASYNGVTIGSVLNGVFTATNAVIAEADGSYTIAGITGVTGAQYEAYKSALVDYVATQDAVETAQVALGDAIADLNENPDGVYFTGGDDGQLYAVTDGEQPAVDPATGAVTNAVANPVADYLNAKGSEADLLEFQAQYNDLKADWSTFKDLEAQFEASDQGILDAVAAIENGATDDPAGLSIDVVKYDQPANQNVDELYIYDADANNGGIDLATFGVQGTDYAFFGTEFSFVELTGDQVITDTGLGSASALEIFADG